MDFNFKKFTSDAAAVFSRAVQLTEEKLGKAEKTELDAHFESLIQRADKTEDHTKRILGCVEGYLQPNPTVRMEEFFYEKLEIRKEHRMTNLEALAQAMTDAGNEFGPGTAYGSSLLKVAATQAKLGTAERDFIGTAAANVLTPLKRFLEGDMKTIAKERKILMNKRLDLDSCKSRLRKAKSLETQANAEADLRVAQSEFDKQSEILKLLLEGIQTAHNNHLKCLRDFVEAQMAFYALCHQHMADLQRDLSGVLSMSQLQMQSSGAQFVAGNDLALSSSVGGGHNGQTSAAVFDPADMGTKRARVVFDYEAIHPSEISVRKDEALIVYRLPGLDPDYVMAEKGNVRGRVPVSYIEIVK